ncbi:MAG: glycosyltransferase family 4 protein, partial [Planctomycetes bacterium]|nr:glycosyltransferase family 4 protein [Planctomycetota bacterium]
ESMPQTIFTMICPNTWNSALVQFIHDRADSLPNLTFIESVPLNEILPYFRSARLVINTSDHEGMPNTFLQAGLSGTPVVSLRVDPDDMFASMDCGLIADGSLVAFANQVQQLMMDDVLWREKSKNISRYIEEQFSEEKSLGVLKNAIG